MRRMLTVGLSPLLGAAQVSADTPRRLKRGHSGSLGPTALKRSAPRLQPRGPGAGSPPSASHRALTPAGDLAGKDDIHGHARPGRRRAGHRLFLGPPAPRGSPDCAAQARGARIEPTPGPEPAGAPPAP